MLGIDRTAPPIRLGAAARAMRALLNDPDDTAQVFRIIEALSGDHGRRLVSRIKKTGPGARIFDERPSLATLLADRESLSKLPDGTLGREYLRFLDREGITTEGLKKANEEGSTLKAPPELEYLQDRLRDQHDLWHVLTGYHGDLIGEAALLAFSFAQTRNPGVGFIVAIALLRGRESQVRRMIARGFRRGLRAEFLPAVPWETLLALPVEEVRRRLSIDAPPTYDVVRSSDYKAAQMC